MRSKLIVTSSKRKVSHLIPNPPQPLPDLRLQLMGLPEHLRQLLCQPGHLFLEGLAVVLLLLDAHISAGGEDVVLLGDFLRGGHGAEALDILQGAVHKGVVGVG